MTPHNLLYALIGLVLGCFTILILNTTIGIGRYEKWKPELEIDVDPNGNADTLYRYKL